MTTPDTHPLFRGAADPMRWEGAPRIVPADGSGRYRTPAIPGKRLWIRGIVGVWLVTLANVTWAADPDAEAAFALRAPAALAAMQAKADALRHLQGAAVIAVIPGDKTRSWTSRMQAVGTFIVGGKTNVLAVAYAKMAEMADTLQRSGARTRPPYRGENAFEGGLIVPVPGGYMAAAFSGGASALDLQVAQAGLEALTGLPVALPPPTAPAIPTAIPSRSPGPGEGGAPSPATPSDSTRTP